MEKFICKYCGKECINANSLRNHERLCKENPDRQIIKSNFIDYNKKVKNHEIKKHNQYTKAKELGLPKPIVSKETREKIGKASRGRKMSEEQKQKISETQKENYKGKSRWYTQIQNRLSYPEQYFIPIFNDALIHYHVNRYFLDFAWPDKKIYIEVDGEQHRRYQKNIEHDNIRTEILNNEGWILIERIYWPEYIKLNFEERQKYINDIKNKINSY